jgi:DNA-binding transcriptional regulator YiaG
VAPTETGSTEATSTLASAKQRRAADRAVPHLRLLPRDAPSLAVDSSRARVDHRAALSSYETFRIVGSRIRDIRRRGKFTQREIAARASISQAALSNYEHGKRDMALSILLAIAGALGTSAVDLLAGLEGH